MAENALLRGGATAAETDMVLAIRAAVGKHAVTCREIVMGVAARRPAVASALKAALGEGYTIRRLGKRLARLEGCGVRRIGEDREGGLYVFGASDKLRV